MKPQIAFIAAVLGISLLKTHQLSSNIQAVHTEHVLVWDNGRPPNLYPSIPGSDTPIPFSKATGTSSRAIGASRLYYATFTGSTIRDVRFRSILRQSVSD